MFTFRIREHVVRPDTQMVEILDGDRIVGAIYPGEVRDIRIVSKYLDPSTIRGEFDFPCAVRMQFAREPVQT